MPLFNGVAWKLPTLTPVKDPFIDKSPRLLATPYSRTVPIFSLPSGGSSASSSNSSLSSSETFWTSPPPSRWPVKYIPAKIRNSISIRQAAIISCLLLVLLIWSIPQPLIWRHRAVNITVQQPLASPYQVLRPVSQVSMINKHAPDPASWLAQNSNNRYAENTGSFRLKSISLLGHHPIKPRAALISLVRNSELPGMMQSMRQLEIQWNRKYRYPWVFFNDEPFSDEFKVGRSIQR